MKKAYKPKILLLKTLMAMVKNSLGSKTYRNFYARFPSGRKKDVTENGRLSCALYVSSILAPSKLIKSGHLKAETTVKDLLSSGWQKTNKLEAGNVLVWGRVIGTSNPHKHIGFYVGNGIAVSNSSKLGYPAKHPWDFKGKRRVELVLRHQDLRS